MVEIIESYEILPTILPQYVGNISNIVSLCSKFVVRTIDFCQIVRFVNKKALHIIYDISALQNNFKSKILVSSIDTSCM